MDSPMNLIPKVTEFKVFGEFTFFRSQKDAFKSGLLWKKWYQLYPNLFDEKNDQWGTNQGKDGFQFVESMAKILLHTTTGYLALPGNEYRYNPRLRKENKLAQIVSPETLQLIEASVRIYHSQCPDILMYAPDCSDYFFCEVKGPGDKLREKQINLYKKLEEVSGKSVYLIYFKEINDT